MIKRILIHQGLATLLLATILVIGALPAWAGERYALVQALGSGQDGQGELAQMVALALQRPQEPSLCRRLMHCHPDRMSVALDASPHQAAALAKLKAGVAQLLVAPGLLASIAQQGGDRRLPALPDLRTLASLGTLHMLIAVPVGRSTLGISNLRDMRLVFGLESSDLTLAAQALFASLGLDTTNYKPIYVTKLADRLQRLTRGQAEAVIVLAPELPPEFLAALSAGEVELITPSKSEVQKLLLAQPVLRAAALDLPGGQQLRTLHMQQLLVTTSALPTEPARAILERLTLAQQSGLYPGLVLREPLSNPPLHAARAAYDSNK